MSSSGACHAQYPGYPGPPTPGSCFYFHRLTRAHLKDPHSRYTPQAWYLGQFGFTGFYIAYGNTYVSKMAVGVYLSNGNEPLRRPIRCRITVLDMSGKDKEDLVLVDETMDSVGAWARGAEVTIKFKEISKFSNEKGSLLFRYDTEWC
ncbi:uncharacterized protein LOC101855566 isoform X2 [Aplysia californica]|uniref:Uncharacterized protein LOC101855566 isoform X2 n=1 Tax=Aplysia californica TaxID=6500 RepID=A0ABM0JR93_APLCA|nr:uncharacterized protein LOC101855566 isoform X2 [Aplysia californica]XP_035825990.1 uncharacterized protein LOC101855566 isoform X2 [Aplysia californica]